MPSTNSSAISFVEQSYQRYSQEISTWIAQLAQRNVPGTESGSINLDKFNKTQEGKVYEYLCHSFPQVPSNPKKKEEVLKHPHCYFESTTFTINQAQNYPPKGLHIPKNIKKAFIDVGISLSIDAILSAAIQPYTSSPGGMSYVTEKENILNELCLTLHKAIYAVHKNQDRTILLSFYALAQQHHLHPSKKSVECLLN